MAREVQLVTLAIFVSRVDAVVVSSMLRGYGIHVDLGADSHGATDPISLALGGYRLRVFPQDHRAASDILRGAGATENHVVSTGARKAIVRFALAWLGIVAVYCAPALWLGGFQPGKTLLLVPLQLVMPVNPQGKADYFLAPASGG